ncbi:MAG: CoA pyrophosphatase [Dehalococcoidia bacterium]|nr:MAG: CoA pyrophosphatase [Dehalococcoidia bacterium]
MTSEAPWRQGIKELLSRRQRQVITAEGLKPSAVLVLIYEKMGEYYMVLTKRTQDVEHHKGQMSFPGGAYDERDSDLETTALREAFEEIGVRGEDVEILGNLDDQATLTSNFVITPYVGAIPYPYEFRVNRREVEELIEAPVAVLLNPDCFRPQGSKGRFHPHGYYRCGEYNITGITAIILKQFLELVFG